MNRSSKAASTRATNGRIMQPSLLLAYVRCLVIMAGCTVVGTMLGLGGALIALEFAEGDARGGELLFIGFAIIIGGASGFLVGAGWSALRLQSRREITS